MGWKPLDLTLNNCLGSTLLRVAHITVCTCIFLECISNSSVFPSCSQADWDFLASFDFYYGFSVTWRGMEVSSVPIPIKPLWGAVSVHHCLDQTRHSYWLQLLCQGKGEIIIVSLQTRLKYLSSNVKRSKYGINYSNRFAQKKSN